MEKNKSKQKNKWNKCLKCDKRAHTKNSMYCTKHNKEFADFINGIFERMLK